MEDPEETAATAKATTATAAEATLEDPKEAATTATTTATTTTAALEDPEGAAATATTTAAAALEDPEEVIQEEGKILSGWPEHMVQTE